MKQLAKCFVIFWVMGPIYYLLEVLYDGSSHWTMLVVAGICGVFGDLLNEYRPDMSILKQCVLITLVILVFEYFTGYILNIRLGMDIWNYRELPLNLNGQICLYFGLVWFFIFSPLVIWMGDKIRHLLWNEEQPMPLISTYKQLLIELFYILFRPTTRIGKA